MVDLTGTHRDVDRSADREPDLIVLLPDFAGGGAERSAVTLAQGIAERGWTVEFAVFSDRGPLAAQVARATPISDLGCVRARAAPFAIARHLNARRPKVLLSFMLHTNLAAALGMLLARHKPRLIWSVRNLPEAVIGDLGPIKAPVFRRLLKAVAGQPSGVAAVSQGVAEAFREVVPRLADKTVAIYNPVLGARVPVERKPRQEHEPPMILGIGRLTEQKNFPLLLSAFAALRKHRIARLVILGEGDQRAALEAQAASLGISGDLEMPGFVDRPMDWLARADVFAMTSNFEGLGNVLVEAMAAGVPVVSTDWPPSAREVLGDGRWGRIVPLGDSAALTDALIDTLEKGGPDAKARAMDFTVDQCVTAYCDLLFGRQEP